MVPSRYRWSSTLVYSFNSEMQNGETNQKQKIRTLMSAGLTFNAIAQK
jgi:hypothetical protein